MKSKKTLLIICLVFIILLSIGTSIYILINKKEKSEFKVDGIETVQNENILNDTTVENLQITNASLLTRDGISTYSAEVNNLTENDITIDKLYVTFYEGDIENKILALFNASIKANGKAYINITSENDLSNTDKITYTIGNNNQ